MKTRPTYGATRRFYVAETATSDAEGEGAVFTNGAVAVLWKFDGQDLSPYSELAPVERIAHERGLKLFFEDPICPKCGSMPAAELYADQCAGCECTLPAQPFMERDPKGRPGKRGE